ncbi:cell division protein SepF [Tessaracoccus flavescens]|uniref:Cell division protein SepF n=1 Tax=Tessaracoccus flavescens TaxID=399497 RepID=A0A1Q2D2C4_9ACTN|nr:cell division protein SepF [Tessaracoccus flavescens]AQP52423.1 cell division protein SepF [Tessaracoccus flavescens]
MVGVRKLAAWMGLVEDGRYVDDDQRDAEGEELTSDVYVDDEPSKVSQLPARRPTQLTPVAEKEVADLSRIVSVRPRSYNEARVIGENFRDGIPVIMNLSDMEDGEDKRLVDFAAGLIFGMRGNIERVSSKVFLLCPQNLVVGPEDKERIASGGFFNQS